VIEGHDIQLICPAEGTPAPKITWWRGNEKIISGKCFCYPAGMTKERSPADLEQGRSLSENPQERA